MCHHVFCVFRNCRYDSGDEDNFSQPRIFYTRVLDEGARTRLINNIVGHMSGAASFLQERSVRMFANVDADFGRRLSEGLRAKAKSSL